MAEITTPEAIGASGDRLLAVVESIAGFTTPEKLELIERIVRSVRDRTGAAESGEGRPHHQAENRARLIEEMAALPAIPHDDGLSNRDHDRILYGSPS